MPPAAALQARQPQSPSYSPVMHVLGRPLQYFLFSKFVFWVTIIGIRMTNNKSDIRALFQNSSYPIVIGIVSFNLLLSVFLCIYYLLNTLFFGRHPTMTEHTVIVEKLFNFFSFKIVLVGMVIEPDIFGFSVWLAWYAVLASMKAILQYGQLRLNIIVDTNTATVYSYIRPFFHLVFGLFFVSTGFYYWKVVLCTAGHFGLSMLVLFDLVTLFIELFQSTVMYVVCILKADAEGNTTSSTSNVENTADRSAEVILNENISAQNNIPRSTTARKNTKIKIFKMMNSLLIGNVAKFSGFLRLWARKLDYGEFQSTVDLSADILILSISLIHYFHVYTINGLSLSLVDIFLFLNIRTTGNLLLQKLHISFISHKTKRTIDRVFPDYNIALREIAIAAAIQKANIEKERRKEMIYRASFLGISSRIINRIIPDFGFSRFFKSNNVNNERKINGNNSDEKSEKDTVINQVEVINCEKEKAKREEEDVCPICLDSLTLRQSKMLPCGHPIHTQCLRTLVVKTSFEKSDGDSMRAREMRTANNTAAADADQMVISGEIGYTFPIPRYIMGGGRPFLLPPNPPRTQTTYRTPHVPYIFGLSTFGGQSPHPTAAPLRFMLFKCPMCRCDIDSYSGALHEKCETDRIGGSGDIMGSVPSAPNRPRNRRSNVGLFNDLFRGGSVSSGHSFHNSHSNTSSTSLSSSTSSSSSILPPGMRHPSHTNPLHPPPSPRHQSLSDSALYSAFTSPSNLAAMADDARARLGTPVHLRYDRRNNI